VLAAISSNISSVITPQALVVAAGNATLLPSLDSTVKDVPLAVALKLVDTLWFTSVTLRVLRAIASNIPVDITPLTEVVATGITAFVPSDETIVLAASVPVIVRLVLTLWFISDTLAVLRTTASNIPVDITPLTEVVATGIVASVPSEDVITLAPAVPVIAKLVVTLWFTSVAFAVLRATASNEALLITPDTLAVATGIVTSFPVDEVITLAAVVPVMAKLVATFASAPEGA
jgi:hypothetical protein